MTFIAKNARRKLYLDRGGLEINAIFDVLEDRFSTEEILEFLGNINEDKIVEYAIYHNVCPKCYAELSLYTYFEDKGEHFGMPVKEELSELRCVSCGWTDGS